MLKGRFTAPKPVALLLLLLLFSPLVCVRPTGWWWRTCGIGAAPPQHSASNVLAQCVTQYGTILGYAHDIPAFSNCHRQWKAERRAYVTLSFPHEVLDSPPKESTQRYVATDVCWIAMEFAVRFYYYHRGISLYYAVDDAVEYWSALHFFGSFGHERRYDVVRLQNFAEAKTAKERKRIAPKFSDIVVWSAEATRGFDNEGHVAVVVHTEGDVEAAGGKEELLELTKEQLQPQVVYIAEQNFDNKPWEGRNFSRVLRFSWRNGREAVLQDSDGNTIIGWVRPGKMRMVDANDDDL